MSFFSNLFDRKKLSATAANLGLLKTDMHSHFIPGIDDGAKTMEDSLRLIRGMKELGYEKVITTPHTMSDYYQNTPGIILDGLENVREELKKNNINIQLEAASEYYVDYEFGEKLKRAEVLTFSGKHVLIEVSFLNPPDNLEATIFNLNIAGYKPILAHPERYPYWHGNMEKYERLRDMGALLQVNILSLTQYYSKEVNQTAMKLVDLSLVDLLGTDMHHDKHLEAICTRALYEPYLHKLLESGKLLNASL
ncbi:MAG: Tyrosine-protein phosphatase YwqE [Bacteroidia bacterium]|nr:Tyrosine-protein phosphatase YwqE [Bacteroidia bacterium]